MDFHSCWTSNTAESRSWYASSSFSFSYGLCKKYTRNDEVVVVDDDDDDDGSPFFLDRLDFLSVAATVGNVSDEAERKTDLSIVTEVTTVRVAENAAAAAQVSATNESCRN